MRVLGLSGWSGSGKTTLIVRLVPELVRRGVRVSSFKHAHHGFDIDVPGKDSYEHRAAGATEVMVSSVRRWALVHENRGEAEPTLVELIRRMTPVDLLIVEGFKTERHEKLEVHRPALGKSLLAATDPFVVAVATDAPIAGLDRPLLDLNDVPAIADFVVRHCGLGATAERSSV
ncbi:MAG: molybdopterin-guanine dinucleotide biosynthesis protein B [Rhodospirillales bacterium]|nr:molybdopterin-guanine dinucleotide biosynthesis protein B [Rhodospirillales bacterium]